MVWRGLDEDGWSATRSSEVGMIICTAMLKRRRMTMVIRGDKCGVRVFFEEGDEFSNAFFLSSFYFIGNSGKE